MTDQPTEQEKQGLDCLICHAKNYDMSKRFPVPAPDTKEGFRIPQDRSLEAARSVGDKPTKEACLRCHTNPAGGPWWKRGLNFSPERDVHAAKDMACVDCHKATDHKFANGNDPGGWAKETTTATISCNSCHQAEPHKRAELNKHQARMSCNVCHTPTIGGVVTRDYIHLVKNAKTGLWDPKADAFDSTYTTKPTYLWFNGMSTTDIHPIGAKEDPKSKIAAFKPLTTVLPVDAKTGQMVFMNLGVLFKTGSVDQAIAKGVEATKQPYSGAWQEKTITGYFILSHDVTREKALTCADCHSEKDYLGLKNLGYSPADIKSLTDGKNPKFK